MNGYIHGGRFRDTGDSCIENGDLQVDDTRNRGPMRLNIVRNTPTLA